MAAAALELAESVDDDDNGNDEKIDEVDKACPSERILEMSRTKLEVVDAIFSPTAIRNGRWLKQIDN